MMNHVSLGFALGLSCIVGCSSSSHPATTDAGHPSDSGHSKDAGHDGGSHPNDGGTKHADAGKDAVAVDAGHEAAKPDSGKLKPGFQIVTVSGAPLTAAAGDAIPLKVVYVEPDGGVVDLPAGTVVDWVAPVTVTAQDPWDAGPNSVLPDSGAAPTGIFIKNPYRTDRMDYPGTLFLIRAGATAGATVEVKATLPDGGTASAKIPVADTPAGNPDAGRILFADVLNCAGCHGAAGQGSPGVDGGAEAGIYYVLQGADYPYPAPPLNNTGTDGGGPNLAADPDWSAALLGMAAQGDIDNMGVALRKPMPDWLGKKNAAGKALSAQDFAHIYAFLKLQKTQ